MFKSIVLAAALLSSASAFAFPRGPILRRGVVCSARNIRGVRFTARGVFPGAVQQRALSACYAAGSARCVALGCF